MKHKVNLFRFFFISLIFGVVFSSCHSSKDSVRWEDPIYAKNSSSKGISSKKEEKGNYSRPNVKTGEVEGKVIDAACAWIGTPYLYGGNTRRGVDCSGLICMAFETGAGIRLPRASHQQADFCKKIDRKKVRPGDLIFFVSKKGGSRINHVALYIGENRVVHATSSRGVIISSLEDEYWRTHFHSCGRVFD